MRNLIVRLGHSGRCMLCFFSLAPNHQLAGRNDASVTASSETQYSRLLQCKYKRPHWRVKRSVHIYAGRLKDCPVARGRELSWLPSDSISHLNMMLPPPYHFSALKFDKV